MWPRDVFKRWQGIALSLVAVVATVWLAASGQLGLYIHPRYFVFTVVMAALGLVFVVAGFTRAGTPKAKHGGGWRIGLSAIGALVLGVLAVGVIAVPPATLTSATVVQRDINAGGLSSPGDTEQAAALVGTGDFERLGVKDWVSLLAQSSDPAFYADKTARVVGFISPDAQDPDNVFYVARFVVTCCAVDAQPIGVPVYLPDWKAQYEKDEWVQVTGTLSVNPSAGSTAPLALQPSDILSVEQPSDPYVY
ncbi:TIGR03943 family putative permease subunit [Luethyella okanaganae]|uniref:TIGR03943 family putative permease subunit n=1 Tax=Luethyella okanaganae TaxID=69372 RepID=A0ABW1VBX4_9MICO